MNYGRRENQTSIILEFGATLSFIEFQIVRGNFISYAEHSKSHRILDSSFNIIVNLEMLGL